MDRTGALQDPISPELVLVDADLAVRAREALPTPPLQQREPAEPRQRVEATPAAMVEERPAQEAPPDQPSFSRHLRATVVFSCFVVALVAAVSLALDLVPGSAKPRLAASRAVPTAPAPPKTPTSTQAPSHPKAHHAVKQSHPARKAKASAAPTRSPKRSAPPAPAPRRAPKPAAPAAVKVERSVSWRPIRGAAFYEVVLRRGATTIYHARTSKRTVSIRLELRPGTYHAVVRPAIPNDAGITLGRAIVDRIVRV